jgi:hypothetical protein
VPKLAIKRPLVCGTLWVASHEVTLAHSHTISIQQSNSRWQVLVTPVPLAAEGIQTGPGSTSVILVMTSLHSPAEPSISSPRLIIPSMYWPGEGSGGVVGSSRTNI